MEQDISRIEQGKPATGMLRYGKQARQERYKKTRGTEVKKSKTKRDDNVYSDEQVKNDEERTKEIVEGIKRFEKMLNNGEVTAANEEMNYKSGETRILNKARRSNNEERL